MTAKRRRKKGEPPRPPGRPRGHAPWCQYTPEMAERGFALAQQGAIDTEIAEELGISVRTFYRLCHEHPELRQATRLGKDAADDRMEQALYSRGVGHSQPAVKIFLPAGSTEPVIVPYVEHFPPDTAAATLWLKNRRPDKWRDKVDHELSGPGGGPIPIQRVERVVVDPAKPSAADTDGAGIPPAPEAGEV